MAELRAMILELQRCLYELEEETNLELERIAKGKDPWSEGRGRRRGEDD